MASARQALGAVQAKQAQLAAALVLTVIGLLPLQVSAAVQDISVMLARQAQRSTSAQSDPTAPEALSTRALRVNCYAISCQR